MTAATVDVATAGKFLTFNLGDEHYGLEILRVQEIVGLLPVTRVPRLPAHIAGVVNLRGRVIPVVDLRVAFGFENREMTERTCIIVAHIKRRDTTEVVMGALVDEVSDVVDLPAASIEETPEFGTEIDTSFIKGIGRLEERVVLLLDIDKVLDTTEIAALERAVTETCDEETSEGDTDA